MQLKGRLYVMEKESQTMNFAENAALREFVRRAHTGQRLGIVTDMDGTISPVAPTPDAARVTPKSRDLLRQLATQVTLVAAVSGRGAGDLHEHIDLPELIYVGSHGLERWQDGEMMVIPEALAYRPALERVIAALEPHMQPGMVMEDKRVTLAIHYRATPDPTAAREALAPLIAQASRANGLGFFEGRMVFEVMPEIQVDKGHAFARLIDDYALEAAVYVGDDVTDAAALRMAKTLRQGGKCYALGVGVESAETPAQVQESADFLVAGVSGVEDMLGWLSSALSASST